VYWLALFIFEKYMTPNNKTHSDRFSVKKRMLSFRYAFSGIKAAIRTQHNMWIHLTAAVIVLVFGFLFRLSTFEWIAISMAIGMVLSAEIFNSAIELLTDMVSPEINPKAGRVKDMAAGAVLIAAITAAVIGLIIFAPKIIACL
jgi:diacylglycerol kinase (ATP)